MESRTVIDPIHSLAFSIQASPGVYAVLLGSGVSRAAKIPTGWEVTLELIRKLAKISGENCEPDPENWYRKKFDTDPDYSDLLDQIAQAPAERQQLLRGYFEATDQEREDGEKQPTEAHRAIAELAAKGFVRVIITTNFDRLIETALRNAGVEPTVLSTPDDVQGSLPLIHTRCCVFKVHGDYLDTRIKNSPSELSQYPPEFEALLDNIFDEFGIVVCGWSADWDHGLRAAIFRSPSRRFTMFWAAKGTVGEQAQKIIDNRDAKVISIEDADTFFRNIWDQVQSIEEFSKPHPLSTEAAVASLKRYISTSDYRVQLFDLVDNEIDRLSSTISSNTFPGSTDQPPTRESVTARVRGLDSASSTLLSMAVNGGFWAKEEHFSTWHHALQRLGSNPLTGGYDIWIGLERYPATLLLYALGIGAVASDRLSFLSTLFSTTLYRGNRNDDVAIRILPPFCLFERGSDQMKTLEGMERHYAPLNDWLFNTLRIHAKKILPDNKQFALCFDKLEILIALGFTYQSKLGSSWHGWMPAGAFGYRYQHDSSIPILDEIESSLVSDENNSPFVSCGIFGSGFVECRTNLSDLSTFISKLQWW